MNRISLTTEAQRRALRCAWVTQDPIAVRSLGGSGGGAHRRMLVRMIARGWLDKIGSWQLTDRGREIASRELGLAPRIGDALRLHLHDRGQDLTHIDIAVSHLPWAKIIDCPQFWMWGQYEASNKAASPANFRRGNLVELAMTPAAKLRARPDLEQRITLKYPVERVEYIGPASKLLAAATASREASAA